MKNSKMLSVILAALLILSLTACDDDDNDNSEPTETMFTGQQFASEALGEYLGQDYSLLNPDGTTDSDHDGQIDVDDAAIIINTLKDMGYGVNETTLNGIYENYFTEAGFLYSEDADVHLEQVSFVYTVPGAATEEDLKAGAWNLLKMGDLIFLDYDKDLIWDNAAIYLGAYEEYTHAALRASDYDDEVIVENLDDDESIISLDIDFGFSDTRRLDYENISGY